MWRGIVLNVPIALYRAMELTYRRRVPARVTQEEFHIHLMQLGHQLYEAAAVHAERAAQRIVTPDVPPLSSMPPTMEQILIR